MPCTQRRSSPATIRTGIALGSDPRSPRVSWYDCHEIQHPGKGLGERRASASRRRRSCITLRGRLQPLGPKRGVNISFLGRDSQGNRIRLVWAFDKVRRSAPRRGRVRNPNMAISDDVSSTIGCVTPGWRRAGGGGAGRATGKALFPERETCAGSRRDGRPPWKPGRAERTGRRRPRPAIATASADRMPVAGTTPAHPGPGATSGIFCRKRSAIRARSSAATCECRAMTLLFSPGSACKS